MAEIVFDFGNALGKWFYPSKNLYGDFMHALAPLSEGEWRKIMGRGATPPEGIIKVNGQAYAIGNAARRHTIQERPRGAARYREDYYGVAVAYALSEALKRDDGKVNMLCSHPPIDIDYTRNLVLAASKQWDVVCRHGELSFVVRDIVTFDEPLGGYSHFTLTERGEERRNNILAEQYTLVIDVGGYTVDVVAVDPGGNIDIMSAHSTRTGVIDLMAQFEQELRHNNMTLFQDTGDLDPRRIEAAIISGHYKFGRVDIHCSDESQAAINVLVNDVIQVINAAGGAANYDVMLLTGGGAALIYDVLCASLPRVEFLVAERDRSLMKFANVFGGAKIGALLRVMGER